MNNIENKLQEAIKLLKRAYNLNHEDMGWDIDYRDFLDSLPKPPTNFHIEENLEVVANQNTFNAERFYLDELE